MNSLDIIESIYKPYRYTKKGNVTIIDSSSGKMVLKKSDKDLFTLFNYLESRGFYSFPTLIRNIRNKDNVYEYVDEDIVPSNQKMDELIHEMANLHNKTVYFKETKLDDYKEIKEMIEDNINYQSHTFEGLFLNICKEEYQRPSHYLFARNYYKIRQNIAFLKNEVNNWYEDVSKKTSQRVSIVHNNLSLKHFIYNKDGNKIVSWDRYKVDTPILDFVNLYQKEYLNYDFKPYLEKYMNKFELLPEEKKLLFILLSICPICELTDNEMQNVINVQNMIDYLYTTENLVRPYYVENEEKE